MNPRRAWLPAATALALASSAAALDRPDVTFKVFQFPADKIPRIDGNTDDWAMVPDELRHRHGPIRRRFRSQHAKPDPKNLDVKIRVGWVKGLNRLYFLYEAYDDYWDFARPDLHNDTFEIVVDGDASGGPLIDKGHKEFWTPEHGRRVRAAPDDRISVDEAHWAIHGRAGAELPHLHAGGGQGLVHGLEFRDLDQGTAVGQRRLRLQFQAGRVRQTGPGILDHARLITPAPRARSAPWNPCSPRTRSSA